MGFEDNKLDQKILDNQQKLEAKNQEIFELKLGSLEESLIAGKNAMIKSGNGASAISLYENAFKMLEDTSNLDKLHSLEEHFIKTGLIQPQYKIKQEHGREIEDAKGTRHELGDK